MKKASFKTRARVVDLLGREQIADAPTAITELLKNAVDAQADEVIAHYHTEARLLEIGDDGLGMRPVDFLEKWLVLATDSKRGRVDEEWLKFADAVKKKRAKTERPFGEKGIGRLAVASLGKGLLLWTRWGEGKDAKRSMALLHWELFRFPRLNLEDILVPYIELTKDDDAKEYAQLLLDELSNWFSTQSKGWEADERSKNLKKTISDDLHNLFPKALNAMSEEMVTNKPGTYFAILSASEEVDEIFRNNQDAKRGDDYLPSEGLRAFYGFCDPFNKEKPRLKVSVLVDGSDAFQYLQDFWTHDDLRKGDHFIDIRVDKNGFAEGDVKKYEDTVKYEFNASDLPPRQKFPGRFRICLGYLQGKASESMLSPEAHRTLDERLQAYGGLFVYRNGIRVMPYGRYDQDFLSFEERRSRNAGRYFFSHRRMFGAIYISQQENPDLFDKAGREGFIKNAAYRGLVTICMEIFKDLAYRHFGSESEKTAKKAKEDDSVEIEIRQATLTFSEEFKESKRFLSKAEREMERRSSDCAKLVENISSTNLERFKDIEKIIYEMSDFFENSLSKLISRIPDMVRPSNKQLAVWDSYLTERQQYENKYYKFLNRLNKDVQKAYLKFAKRLDAVEKLRRRRMNNENELIRIVEEKRDALQKYAYEIWKTKSVQWFEAHKKQLRNIPNEMLGTDSIEEIIDRGERGIILFEEALSKQRRTLRDEIGPYWDALLRNIARIASARSLEKALGNLAREKEALEEREGIYAELAQVGLIVEGIDHEFRALFGKAKKDFILLESTPSNEKKNDALYRLKETFSWLDEKLVLLSPLFRTEKYSYSRISGEQIRSFVEAQFSDSDRNSVVIQYTKNFLSSSWDNIPGPAFRGAVLNVVNNALYWAKKAADSPSIRFSLDPVGFVVSNNGPTVTSRDEERIFEPFFSRKPHGRGLGLYLARTALRGHGLDVRLAAGKVKGTLDGASFIFVCNIEKEDNITHESNT